jgi:hypothetical protein
MLHRIWLFAAASLVILSTSAGAQQSPEGVRTEPPGPAAAITPVVGEVIAAPRPVLGSDGLRHLAYEVMLTSFQSTGVTLSALEVLDSDQRVMRRLDGQKLQAMWHVIGPQSATSDGPGGVRLEGGRSGYVLIDVALAAADRPPERLVHRLTLKWDPLPPAPGSGQRPAPPGPSSITAPTKVDLTPPVVVSPPLRGARWLAGNGCCDAFDAHRAAVLPVDGAVHVAERFAIDWIQVDAAGKYFGAVDKLEQYPTFGHHVYSATDGVVVATQDGVPESTPPDFPAGATAQTAGGNYIVIQIAGVPDQYAFYAHLQPGSLRVRLGEKVARGAWIGLAGNSGNSDGPHLHFHVMDGIGPLTSNGLPYVIDGFTSRGTVTNIDAVAAGKPAELSDALKGGKQDRLPLNNELVDFPPGP